MQDMQVRSLGREDPLEKEMATHSSVLGLGIPRTEEPGRLQSREVAKSQTWLSDWITTITFWHISVFYPRLIFTFGRLNVLFPLPKILFYAYLLDAQLTYTHSPRIPLLIPRLQIGASLLQKVVLDIPTRPPPPQRTGRVNLLGASFCSLLRTVLWLPDFLSRFLSRLRMWEGGGGALEVEGWGGKANNKRNFRDTGMLYILIWVIQS